MWTPSRPAEMSSGRATAKALVCPCQTVRVSPYLRLCKEMPPGLARIRLALRVRPEAPGGVVELCHSGLVDLLHHRLAVYINLFDVLRLGQENVVGIERRNMQANDLLLAGQFQFEHLLQSVPPCTSLFLRS